MSQGDYCSDDDEVGDVWNPEEDSPGEILDKCKLLKHKPCEIGEMFTREEYEDKIKAAVMKITESEDKAEKAWTDFRAD